MSERIYLGVSETADRWKVSRRSVRDYCEKGRVEGALLSHGEWKIPAEAEKPGRKRRQARVHRNLLSVLRMERETSYSGGIYHKIQIDLTYNSNHIEGSKLTHEQTRYIFETRTIGVTDSPVNVDDIIETVNHFSCIDAVIDSTGQKLSESLIKRLHGILKSGTEDSRKAWFMVGEYKKLPNEVASRETARPEDVKSEMRALLASYNAISEVTLDDILDFHVRFERIHPFQDGNGRIGRLIMFRECLRNDIVPFIITEELKMYYYRGLEKWDEERGWLRDTCLTAQDDMRRSLEYFRIDT